MGSVYLSSLVHRKERVLDFRHFRVLSEDVTGNRLSSMQEAVDGGIHFP